MTQNDLQSLIAGAAWFTRCGQFPGEPGAIPLATLASADAWDWLPTAHDQADPVHGTALIAKADAAGLAQVRRDAELAVACQALSALQAVPDSLPALRGGPHDLTQAAKSGAAFAARMAAREVVIGRPGFWCRAVELYAAGYWPCGLTDEDRRLVIW